MWQLPLPCVVPNLIGEVLFDGATSTALHAPRKSNRNRSTAAAVNQFPSVT